MNRFFKIPNLIFDYQLSPAAFYLYTYMTNTFYWKKSVRIKLKTISIKCDMSVNTVRSALDELCRYRLVEKIRHKNIRSGYTTTNEYVLHKISGRFAMIDKNVFNYLKTDKSAALIFCAIAFHQNAHNKAFPSYTQLQELTGLSRTTCINKVADMFVNGVICKEHHLCFYGDFGHNNYTTFSMKFRVFLFSIIYKNYGRFVVFYECYEYNLTIELSSGKYHHGYKKKNFTHVWYQAIARYEAVVLFSSQKGSKNFDKPIIDPLYLRIKTEKRRLNSL